jgi:hypothetical protein
MPCSGPETTEAKRNARGHAAVTKVVVHCSCARARSDRTSAQRLCDCLRKAAHVQQFRRALQGHVKGITCKGNTAALLPTYPCTTCDWMESTAGPPAAPPSSAIARKRSQKIVAGKQVNQPYCTTCGEFEVLNSRLHFFCGTDTQHTCASG